MHAHAARPHAAPWKRWSAPAGLACAVFAVYLGTLTPGVAIKLIESVGWFGGGDSAELQYMAPLVGVCHPPGYPFLTLAGKLFTLLPLGSVAWRINLMMAVFGTLGALALFGALRRITRQALPALVGAGTLAFSSAYWKHCITPEAYVFYGTVLLLGVYAFVRFVETPRTLWLVTAAAALGVCVSNRLSELLVLPALLALWIAQRGQAPFRLRQVAIATLAFLAPFAVTLLYFFAREDPRLLHARDDALRDAILDEEPAFTSLPFGQKLREAVLYCTAQKWADEAEFKAKRFWWDADKYAWLLSGAGAFGERYPGAQMRVYWPKSLEQGVGVSVGAPALVLALVGGVLWIGRWGYVLLGVLLVAGNTCFYFYHTPPDNLDFILPSVAGYALLAGLGAAGAPRRHAAKAAPPARSGALRRVYQGLCLLAPLFLLAGNYRQLDESTPATRQQLAEFSKIATAAFPQRSVILARYDQANSYRYLLYIEGRRADISVLIYRARYPAETLSRLLAHFAAERRPVFLSVEMLRYAPPGQRQIMNRRTPPELRRLGFFQAAG